MKSLNALLLAPVLLLASPAVATTREMEEQPAGRPTTNPATWKRSIRG